MTAPNLLALTTVNIDTAIALATVAGADLIAAVTTNHAKNFTAIFCANYHASAGGYITVKHKRSGTEYPLVPRTFVNAGQVINGILGKEYYVPEGDQLRIYADADLKFVVLAPFSDVT